MKNILKYIFIAVVSTSLYSCDGIDETYKEFLKDSDKLYPGRVDSVQTFTGKERIKFKFLLSSDPKVTHIRIFWNGKLDSLETQVSPQEIGNYKEVLIPSVPEGDHTFYLITYDHNNTPSVPTEVFSKVYGKNFQNKLSNRYIVSSSHFVGNDVEIQWDTPNMSYADVKVKVNYENTTGQQQSVTVPMDEMNTVLKDYKTGKTFSYQTYIRPDTTCMDEFETELKEGQTVFSYYDALKNNPGWTIKAVSDEDPNRPATRCIDGCTDEKDTAGQISYWHTDGQNGNYPHWVVIDMGQPIPVEAFYFVQRTISYNNQLKDIEIFTNETGDDTQPWVSLGTFTLSRKEGRQNVWLDTPKEMRYIKIIFKNDWGNSKNLSLVEFGALQQWK